MADRTISVRLQALVGPYSASMAKARRDTAEFRNEITKSAAKGGEFTKTLGAGMLVAGGAMALGFGKMIGAASQFDQAMSEVNAVAGASAAQMGELRDAAIEAGAATSFSATEAAQATAELVKAGISVSDVLGGGLAGALDLAAAGSLDLATAAEIAAQAMNIFSLRGGDVTHIADVLAAGANKSAADVQQLGDALRQGGLVASQTGMSLEETTGALAAFADNALVGSDAGTSLKTMLQRLTPQSEEAAGLMKQLGFSAYDAAGNFVGLEELAGELQSSLGHLTVEQRNMAMATLFGSDAVRAANILYEEGAEGIAGYVTAVDDQGAAADMAAKKLDNLAGDIEALSGSIETQLIEGGSKATGVLRGMASGATDLVNGFGELPDLMQTGALLLGGVTTAASLAGGAFLVLQPRIAAAKVQLDAIAASSRTAAAGIKGIGTAAGLVGAALPGIAAGMQLMASINRQGDEALSGFVEGLPTAKTAEEFSANIDALIGEYERLQGVTEGSMNNTGGQWQEIGQNLNPWADNTISNAEASTRAFARTIEEMLPQLDRWRAAEAAVAEETGLTAEQVNELAAQLGVDLSAAGDKGTEAVAAVIAAAGDLDAGVPATGRATQSLEEMEAAAAALLEQLEAVGEASGAFTDAFAAYDTVYARAEEKARAHAQEMADAENEGIDTRIEAVREGAAEQGAALMDEASAHIEAAGLTGQAAADVRKAAEDKAKAVRDSADDEIESLGDGKKSWEDYAEGVKVSTADLIAELEAQVKAQTDWRVNLVKIAASGRKDVADELKKMGPEAAPLVQQFADMTTEEMNRAGDLLVQSAADNGQAAGAALEEQLRIGQRLAAVAAGDTADSIAEELGVLVGDVELIAFAMGIKLGEGLKRMRDAISQFWADTSSQVGIGAAAGPEDWTGQADGGLVQYRAGGGSIFGMVPKGTDTVPTMLTPGEFVIRKSAVDSLGVPFLSALNRTRAPFGRMFGSSSTDNSRTVHAQFNYQGAPPVSVSAVAAGRKLALALG